MKIRKLEKSMFNINWNRFLKEFMIENPPLFSVSNKCCHYTKKHLADKFYKDNKTQLCIVGIRKTEGGIRSARYKNCYTHNDGSIDNYRPLFWFNNQDKYDYEKKFGVTHSSCYSEYGMQRTGCAGCPYNRNLEKDQDIIKKYEPNLAKACKNLFKDSYEYTKLYRKFVREQKEKLKAYNNNK